MKKIAFLLFCLSSMITFQLKAQQFAAEKVIKLPGDGGYDYAYIDQHDRRLYASHGSAVNVVDLETDQLVGSITGLGNTHGIAVVNEMNKGFITDSKTSTVAVFDTKTLQVIGTITLKAKGPDALLYDTFSKHLFAFNGDSNNASVIDPVQMKEIATVDLGGAPEFGVSDNAGLIYNNLEDKSSLDILDVKTLKVTKTYPLSPCGGPTGLALDKKQQRAFTVCRENKGMSVVDISTGKVVQTLPIGAGVDAVVYSAENKLIVVSNADGTASIFKQIDADQYKLIQVLKTQYRAKTMAFDSKTNKLYFPVADFEPGTKKVLPGSFKLLVYRLEK